MKQVLCFLLSAVLTFHICCVTARADIVDAGGQWLTDMQTLGDMVSQQTLRVAYNDLVNKPLSGFSTVIATYDSGASVVGAGMRYFASLIKAGNTPEQAVQVMQQDITTNSNNGNRSITGDGSTYIENYYNNGNLNGTGDSLSNLGYTYNYIPSSDYLSPNGFSDGRLYRAIKNLIKNNPDYVFFYRGNYFGNGKYLIYASKIKVYGAVKPERDWGTISNGELYNEDWNTNFDNPDGDWLSLFMYVSKNNSDDILLEYVEDNQNGNVTWNTLTGSALGDFNLNEINDPSIMQSPSIYDIFPASGVLYPDNVSFLKLYSHGQMGNGFYHSNTLQVPVFASLADLKFGTVGKSTAQVLPSYTGNGINGDITDSQITQARDIITNYYQDGTPQGGDNNNNNNNNDDDDDDTSDTWWGKLLDAIKKVLAKVIEILGDLAVTLVESIGEIVSSITSVVNLFDNGFTDLLSAVFPFLPTGMIKLLTLGLALGVLGVIIKIFKGG